VLVESMWGGPLPTQLELKTGLRAQAGLMDVVAGLTSQPIRPLWYLGPT